MLRQHPLYSIGTLNVNSLNVNSLVAALLLLLFAWTPLSVAQETEADEKAFRLQSVAANAQNAKEFEFARKKWQELIDVHGESKAARNAWYHLGNCSYNLEDYGSAILAYKKALPILRTDQSPDIPEVLLALGYSRYREGLRLAKSDPEEAASLFTTAANDLNTILLNHEKSPMASAAAYHRGKAFEANGQKGEAKKAYEKSLEFDDNERRVDAMFNLGGISLDEKDYEGAARWYDRIRTVVDKTKGHKLLDDTNLNYGDSLTNLGVQRLRKNDVEEANKKFQEAKAVLAEVISKKDFDLRDGAIFLDASCSMYLGDDAKAGELFEEVSKFENSQLRERALVLAGSSYLRAGKEQLGTETLNRAIDSSSSFSVDAVHELALWLIETKKHKQAYDLTDSWATKVLGPPVHPLAVDVLLDRANASRNVEELADKSAQLYEEIATNYPKHPLAPGCLYQSAFGNYENGDYDKVIAQTAKFEADYSGDALQSGMREVLGDTLLMQKKYSEAESTFRNLATDFQDSKQDLSGWITRAGFASYLQDNFDATIQWLEQKDALITVPEDKAEALHWIGSSMYQKENYKQAAEKLQQSLDIDRKWSRTPEVMLALCNSRLKLSQFDEAEKTAATMLESFPKDPDQYVSRALYSVGDEAMKKGQYDRATRNFDLISNKLSKSEMAPYAVYQAAYVAVESKNGAEAAKRFADFLKRFDGHELRQKALLGQTNALRMTGNSAESIAGLKKLVAEAADDDTRRKANYQLGLAYADSSDWPNAVSTFSAMTELLTPDTPNADKVWYELAWAQRENGNNEQSLKSFGKLIENHPESSSAPEAHFLLASQAYNDKQYDTAIDQYGKADSDLARDEIREKARYKLGWSHYKKGNFAAASEQFKKQADDFPKGKLYADGRYMIAQCAWRANNFEEAFQAYTVAKPVIEEYSQTDERVKKYASPTLLNGAKSGNKTNNFEKAAEMAKALSEMDGVDDTVKHEAQLELGIAKMSLGQNDAANEALTAAANDGGETGAHAKALIGDIIFKEATDVAKAGDKELSKQKLDKAVEAYAEVYFGYGKLAPKEIKAWQAYASYEAARCYMVQINDAPEVDKVILAGKAIDRYEYLVSRFPEHRLVEESKKQIGTLSKLKDRFAK